MRMAQDKDRSMSPLSLSLWEILGNNRPQVHCSKEGSINDSQNLLPFHVRTLQFVKTCLTALLASWIFPCTDCKLMLSFIGAESQSVLFLGLTAQRNDLLHLESKEMQCRRKKTRRSHI